MRGSIVACICEGGAEHAIMDILLFNEAIIFNKNQLLEDKIIRTRSADKFAQDYLRKTFDNKVIVYRILDSRKEVFKLNGLYKDKVKVINVITAPEIEMLIIHNENKYQDFKCSRKKPSDYCKQDLKYGRLRVMPLLKIIFQIYKHCYLLFESTIRMRMLRREKPLYTIY